MLFSLAFHLAMDHINTYALCVRLFYASSYRSIAHLAFLPTLFSFQGTLSPRPLYAASVTLLHVNITCRLCQLINLCHFCRFFALLALSASPLRRLSYINTTSEALSIDTSWNFAASCHSRRKRYLIISSMYCQAISSNYNVKNIDEVKCTCPHNHRRQAVDQFEQKSGTIECFNCSSRDRKKDEP